MVKGKRPFRLCFFSDTSVPYSETRVQSAEQDMEQAFCPQWNDFPIIFSCLFRQINHSYLGERKSVDL